MAELPAPLKGIPVAPVAVAALVGFSLGLAVSIAIDAQMAKQARTIDPPMPVYIPTPCAECAEEKTAISEPEPEPAPVVTKDADVPD